MQIGIVLHADSGKKCAFDLFIIFFIPPSPIFLFLPIQELVDELYNFRDSYFETHSVEEAGKKQSDVAQEIEKTLKKLEEKEGECCIY